MYRWQERRLKRNAFWTAHNRENISFLKLLLWVINFCRFREFRAHWISRSVMRFRAINSFLPQWRASRWNTKSMKTFHTISQAYFCVMDSTRFDTFIPVRRILKFRQCNIFCNVWFPSTRLGAAASLIYRASVHCCEMIYRVYWRESRYSAINFITIFCSEDEKVREDGGKTVHRCCSKWH